MGAAATRTTSASRRLAMSPSSSAAVVAPPPQPGPSRASRSSRSSEPGRASAWTTSGRRSGAMAGPRPALPHAGGGVADDDVAALGLGLEQDAATALVPHLRDDRIAGEDDAGEAHVQSGEPRRVVVAVLTEYGAGGVSQAAQAVEDGRVVAGHLGEGRVDVQRVAIAGEAVDHRLDGQRRHLDGPVGGPVRGLVAGLWAALAAEAAGAAHEDAGAVHEQHLAALVLRLRLDDDEGAFALIVDAGHLAAGGQLALRRDRPVEPDALLAVEDHHRVYLDGAGEAHEGGERRYHGEGREHLEVALIDEVQVRGADAHRVQHHVAVVVLECRWRQVDPRRLGDADSGGHCD